MSWEKHQLSSICDVFADGDWIESKDQSESGIRLIQTGNVGLGYFKSRDSKARYISEETFKRLRCTEIKQGDILVSRLPDPVGRACVIPELNEKSITAVDCTIIRVNKEKLDSNFLNYFCQSPQYFEQVRKNVTGATRQRISRSLLGKIAISFPSVLIQKEIVKRLDSFFIEINKAIKACEANSKNSDALFQSYLSQLFESGGDDWVSEKLKDITTKIGSGATPKGGNESYKETGISLIRSMNVYDDGFYYPKLAYIDALQAKDLANVTIEEGDVLLNITGGSIARCCVVPSDVIPARVNQHVSIIRPNKELIKPELLHYLLISPLHKRKLLSVGESGGTTRQAITKAQLQDYVVKFPKKLSSQISLIEKINELHFFSIEAKKSYEKKLIDFSSLKNSILKQAFNGELVKE